MSGKRNLSADGCTINTLLLCIRRDVTGLVRRSQQVELLQLDRYGTGINACSSSSGALHVHQTCNRLGNVQTVPLFVKYCNSHKWFALIYAAGFISPPKTLFSINNQWILTTNHALTPTLNSHIQFSAQIQIIDMECATWKSEKALHEVQSQSQKIIYNANCNWKGVSDEHFEFSSHKIILFIIWNFWKCCHQGILTDR